MISVAALHIMFLTFIYDINLQRLVNRHFQAVQSLLLLGFNHGVLQPL